MWTTQIKALIYKTEYLLNSQERATGMLITVTETRLRSDSRDLRTELSQIPIVHAAQDFWKPWWSGNYSWRWPCKSKGLASKPSRSLKAVHNIRFWFRFPRVPLGLDVFRYFPYWRGWSRRFAFTSFGLRTLSWEELRMCSQYWGSRYFRRWFRNSWGFKLPCRLYNANSRLSKIYSLERWMRVLCRRRR